jgi:putative glycosyltransferase (TIGR04372 family)
MHALKRLYKKTVGSITVPVLEGFLRLAGGLPWFPVFYFFLPRQNTFGVQFIHILNNIQVRTGRTIIVVSTWPFWPWDTAKDAGFTSFVHGLSPRIRYIWIPIWLETLLHRVIMAVWRALQIADVLIRPMGLNATIRYRPLSTIEHTDLVNEGPRISLRIPESHLTTLEEGLQDLGVAPDEWFVCVHAREQGWFKNLKAGDIQYPAGYRYEQEDYRNVDIEDYLPAIDYIKSQGGMVVRMGDPSMKRLSGIDRVIDYPFTEHRSIPMDLFLVSRCRFVLGCNSGFSSSFPTPFDTPTLVTNYGGSASTARWPYSNTLFLLQAMKLKETGRVLNLEEMFHPSVCMIQDGLRFEEMGYEWLSNTPEDILEATKEILELVNTGAFDSPRTREQEMFHQYRLNALDAIWSKSERRGHIRFSNVSSSESRISAVFAARYFACGEPPLLEAGSSRRNRATSETHPPQARPL